jgi:hypothetical protein
MGARATADRECVIVTIALASIAISRIERAVV